MSEENKEEAKQDNTEQVHMVVCSICSTIQKMPKADEDQRCPNCSNALVPKPEVQKPHIGRPTKCQVTPELLNKVRERCSHGASIEDIAGMMGIDVSNVYIKMKKNKAFRDAIDCGRDNCRESIQARLFKRLQESDQVAVYLGKSILKWYDRPTSINVSVEHLDKLPDEQILAQVAEIQKKIDGGKK